MLFALWGLSWGLGTSQAYVLLKLELVQKSLTACPSHKLPRSSLHAGRLHTQADQQQ